MKTAIVLMSFVSLSLTQNAFGKQYSPKDCANDLRSGIEEVLAMEGIEGAQCGIKMKNFDYLNEVLTCDVACVKDGKIVRQEKDKEYFCGNLSN